MPLPQPPIILTREGFREWLTKLPEQTMLRQGSACQCAIAQHLTAVAGADAIVGPTRFHFDTGIIGSHELPPWASRFITAFDRAEPTSSLIGLSPTETLAVLDGLPA